MKKRCYNIIKKTFSKKDKGELVSNMMLILMTVLISFFVIFVGIYFFIYSTKINEVEAIMRNGLMKMEAEGGLTPSTKNTINSALSNVDGISNVVISGSPVQNNDGSGYDIFLNVKAKLNYTFMSSENQNLISKIVSSDINLTQHSCALGYGG